MKTRDLKISIVLALCLTVMAVVMPSTGLGVDCSSEPMFQPPNYDIVAVKVPAGSIDFGDPMGPANNPNHSLWGPAPRTVVEAGWKIVADVNNQLTGNDIICAPELQRNLNVQAIHDGTNILFRIVYADTTTSLSIADVPLFHDALAIGVPYPTTLYGGNCVVDGGLTNPEILHMGTPCGGTSGLPCCPMHLMFWRADKAEIENVLANSPGTIIETAETDLGVLNTYQNWNAGAWTLILGRVMIDPFNPVNAYPFQASLPGKNMVDLVPGEPRNIIFANWDGGIQERNGYKFISIFGNLIVVP